jgi:hypothetical protein
VGDHQRIPAVVCFVFFAVFLPFVPFGSSEGGGGSNMYYGFWLRLQSGFDDILSSQRFERLSENGCIGLLRRGEVILNSARHGRIDRRVT